MIPKGWERRQSKTYVIIIGLCIINCYNVDIVTHKNDPIHNVVMVG